MKPFELTPPPPDPIPRHGPLCCEECFDHAWLWDFIKRHSRKTGLCDFCETDDVALIEVSALSACFLNLMTIYSPVGWDNTNLHIYDPIDAGEMLDELIQEDWRIFSDRILDRNQSMELLEAILDAQYTEAQWNSRYMVERRFDGIELYTSRDDPSGYTFVDAWDEHKDEIFVKRGRAKPFGITRSSLERVSNTLASGQILYRARPGYEGSSTTSKYKTKPGPYRAAQIGAPPPSKASAGRANRLGQAVLYCADQDATAVAEVRPARGFYVSLASFRAKRDLQLLDLVMQLPPINPFIETDLRTAVETNAVFREFARDLETPLRHNDDLKTYMPSQNLTESIRRAGFDGIRYPSAMNTGGSNIVLFDTSAAEFVDSHLVEIVDVSVQFEKL